MSQLSELIKINRNIEKQNDEIIRLLKKIAGEDEDGQMTIPYVAPQKIEAPDTSFTFGDESAVGEVYFIEDFEVFKLTIKNNETSIDNLTGSSEACDFAEQEMIANEAARSKATFVFPVPISMNKAPTLSRDSLLIALCCKTVFSIIINQFR